MKETTTEMNVKLSEQKPTYVTKLRNAIMGADGFPDINTRSPERRGMSENVTEMPIKPKICSKIAHLCRTLLHPLSMV